MSNRSRQQIRKTKKKKKRRSPLKIFLITLLILFVASGGALAYYVNTLGDKLTEKSTTQAKKVAKGNPINFLLLGVDAGDYNGKDEHQRSDTMMLIRFIPETDKVYILSIPRDTKVKINGKTQKINAAHAIGGPELTIKTIEDLLDIDINYYGSINYKGFRACVDAIGGVDVVVPQNMNYKASDITIKFNKGENVHLDGEKAEQFVRWRKNNDGTGYALGDVGRAETQQEFMVAFLKKLKSPEGLTKLPTLLNTVTDYAETNMDMQHILSYGKEAVNIDPSSIEKEVLAGEPYYDKEVRTWYYLYDEEKAEAYLNHFRGVSSNKPLDAKDLKLSIYNAAGINGLAASYEEKLKKLGFNVTHIGTYNTSKEKTEVIYYGEDFTISSLKNYLTNVKYKKETDGGAREVKIVLGKDAKDGGILLGSSKQSSLFGESMKSNKENKTIKILNATSKSGLAARYQEKLEGLGYKVTLIGNYNGEIHETQIKYKNDEKFANDIANKLGTGSCLASSNISEDIVIILGNDLID